MAENLKNLLFADGNWLIEVAAENHADIEPYLNNESNQSQENEHKFKLPETIGILPIRNAVAFPGTVTPLAVGRNKSKALLDDTTPNKSIIGLLTQH
ncbi:MAG: hypothetical protein NTW55_04175, partial [Planctomycetota bacterium]|nr:hypothetical protein [Planctomycetota bacterium]